MEFEEAMAARAAVQQRRDAPQVINGCVISLADGAQIATAEHGAVGLTVQIEATPLGKLTTIRTGPESHNFIAVNPFYIVAIQPAAVNPPSEEDTP